MNFIQLLQLFNFQLAFIVLSILMSLVCFTIFSYIYSNECPNDSKPACKKLLKKSLIVLFILAGLAAAWPSPDQVDQIIVKSITK